MSAAIREALDVLLSEPGQVIELRIPRARHTRSGYFDDLDRAAEAAAKLNGTSSVYMTLNPCDPALLARGGQPYRRVSRGNYLRSGYPAAGVVSDRPRPDEAHRGVLDRGRA
jgi:hypothetical protein